MGIESGGKYDQDFRRLLEEEIAERKQKAEPEQHKVVLIGETAGIREVIKRALEGKNIRVITAEAPEYRTYVRRMRQNALFDDLSLIIIPRQQPPRNDIEKHRRMVEAIAGGTNGDYDGNVWTMGYPPGSINYPVVGGYFKKVRSVEAKPKMESVDIHEIDPKAILAAARRGLTLEVKKFNNGRKGPKKHGDRY